jgi:hypothetical protein
MHFVINDFFVPVSWLSYHHVVSFRSEETTWKYGHLDGRQAVDLRLRWDS